MTKQILAFALGVMFALSASVSAMTFSQPVNIGGIGYPPQMPTWGYLVNNATKNSGVPFKKNPAYKNGVYRNGVAQWGYGENALYCSYYLGDKNGEIKFGGENNYIISTEFNYKTILRIDTDEGLTLYLLEQDCVRKGDRQQINLIGHQKNGKWVSYIDSKVLTEKYFSGAQVHLILEWKIDGVEYHNIQVKNDTIIIPYIYNHMTKGSDYGVVSKGEFRFKWDDKAQWFGIEQVVY